MALNRPIAQKLPTGSGVSFESALSGGLSTCALTDIFGAAGTGKTQFAFQCSAFTANENKKIGSKATVAFVDCSGAFRPERVVEIAEARGFDGPSSLLDSILVVNVRSVSEQMDASKKILSSDNEFSDCKLIVVDDVTRNFVADFGTDDSELISRQSALSRYLRGLAHIALTKGAAVLLTNSVRSRFEAGEVETTGELISQFALFRIHFRKSESRRTAEILQPIFVQGSPKLHFEIEKKGLTSS